MHLNRVTVLGRVIARRLHATDSILHGFTVAEDIEDGCFRYSAATAGSRAAAGLQLGLAEQRRGAVHQYRLRAIRGTGSSSTPPTGRSSGGPPGRTLLAGSSAGAQLGVFPAQGGPGRERALRVKYNEYLPFGLVPVIVHVT